MALRTRLRRAFTRGSSDEDCVKKADSKSSKRDSKASKRTSKTFESNIYQPGEKMPPLKYRRPVAPEHKEKLEAFSWAKAWRRHSAQSIYSPMGSRMPSRKTSYSTLGRRSLSIGGRKSRSRHREGGIGVDSGFGGSMYERGDERLREGSDEEGDVTNVGLSRHTTQDPRKSGDIGRSRSRRSRSLHRASETINTGTSRPATDNTKTDRLSTNINDLSTTKAKGEIPFSPEELEIALKRSHLDSPKEDKRGRSPGSPGSPGTPPRGLRPREIQFAPTPSMHITPPEHA